MATPIRVALVDDHRMILGALTEWIRSTADDIDVVAAVPTWPELLTHPEFPVDVVLLDLDLKDNLPVALKISTLKTTGVRTVLMSTYSEPNVVREALGAGALGYLVKSEPVDMIIEAIRAAAKGESLHLGRTRPRDQRRRHRWSPEAVGAGASRDGALRRRRAGEGGRVSSSASQRRPPRATSSASARSTASPASTSARRSPCGSARSRTASCCRTTTPPAPSSSQPPTGLISISSSARAATLGFTAGDESAEDGEQDAGDAQREADPGRRDVAPTRPR